MMGKSFLQFKHVHFGYESASASLFTDVTLHIPPGWTGVVGANGAGKTTLLKLAVGLLKAEGGEVQFPEPALYCPQRTDDLPDGLPELLEEETQSAILIKERLGLGNSWGNRWSSLSHGERKRAQIAVALWKNPELLAIDEPTNHVDTETRDIIETALSQYAGVGLLVSHDRNLLDYLCQQCIFIDSHEVIVRPGGVSKGMQVATSEAQAVQRQQLQKKRAVQKLRRELIRRGELALQSQHRRSKKGVARKDHDAREKIDRARVSGKDAVGGRLIGQMQGRMKHEQEKLSQLRTKKEYRLGISLPGARSHRNELLQIPAGSILLGGQKWLEHPDLYILPSDRIALVGPNGSGKSTLVSRIFPSLKIPPENITYIPQETDADQSRQILAQVREAPPAKLGQLMTLISRLGSRPQPLLESAIPSPGETRKLLLAMGMANEPQIIIMDEPTNHMDLPSIECLEEALSEVSCALLLVSHDRRFLEKLTTVRWNIRRVLEDKERCVLQIT